MCQRLMKCFLRAMTTPLGMSDVNRNNKVFKINLGDVHGDGTVNIPITQASFVRFSLFLYIEAWGTERNLKDSVA
jgi:hypothetical protein